MRIGLSRIEIEHELRRNGIEDETIFRAIAKTIERNNERLERDIQRMIEDAVRSVKNKG